MSKISRLLSDSRIAPTKYVIQNIFWNLDPIRNAQNHAQNSHSHCKTLCLVRNKKIPENSGGNGSVNGKNGRNIAGNCSDIKRKGGNIRGSGSAKKEMLPTLK